MTKWHSCDSSTASHCIEVLNYAAVSSLLQPLRPAFIAQFARSTWLQFSGSVLQSLRPSTSAVISGVCAYDYFVVDVGSHCFRTRFLDGRCSIFSRFIPQSFNFRKCYVNVICRFSTTRLSLVDEVDKLSFFHL